MASAPASLTCPVQLYPVTPAELRGSGRRTPVYMSPELINSRNGAKGYDGKSVDVWASGVLLIVMLLGTFPFDHTEHPDPNTSEAHLEVW